MEFKSIKYFINIFKNRLFLKILGISILIANFLHRFEFNVLNIFIATSLGFLIALTIFLLFNISKGKGLNQRKEIIFKFSNFKIYVIIALIIFLFDSLLRGVSAGLLSLDANFNIPIAALSYTIFGFILAMDFIRLNLPFFKFVSFSIMLLVLGRTSVTFLLWASDILSNSLSLLSILIIFSAVFELIFIFLGGFISHRFKDKLLFIKI